MRPNIIYVCNNDGSDTRVVKEVTSLSRCYDVHFLGIGSGDNSFARDLVATFVLIAGSHRSMLALLQLAFNVVKLRFKKNISSIHVVNEQVLLAILPSIVGSRVVLDLFDSLFLKINAIGEKLWLLKRLLYGASTYIIITDELRRQLMPAFSISKTHVIPNAPFKDKHMPAKTFSNDGVTIAYFGTLLEHRGTSVIRELLEHHPDITALCAGWSVDEPSQELQRHPRVRWLGVIPQREANRIIAKEADYILAIYPSDNYNNRFASPNKIFDAIHTRTPLICSDHIKLSEFVRENNLGLLVGSPGDLNYKEFGKLLKSYKGKFEMNPSLLDQYSWDAFEQKLLDLHAPPTARPQG